MASNKKYFQPSLAELFDNLTINQIKAVNVRSNRKSCIAEIKRINSDIDILLRDRGVKLDSNLIRLIIALAQINLHIWRAKDAMQNRPGARRKQMKLSHQLNGLRNRIKNRIVSIAEGKHSYAKKTNISTDKLQGWSLSVLEHGA
ncbi:hypothetical protein ACFL6Y_06185 [Elusimicrobiota bacterium]